MFLFHCDQFFSSIRAYTKADLSFPAEASRIETNEHINSHRHILLVPTSLSPLWALDCLPPDWLLKLRMWWFQSKCFINTKTLILTAKCSNGCLLTLRLTIPPHFKEVRPLPPTHPQCQCIARRKRATYSLLLSSCLWEQENDLDLDVLVHDTV